MRRLLAEKKCKFKLMTVIQKKLVMGNIQSDLAPGPGDLNVTQLPKSIAVALFLLVIC